MDEPLRVLLVEDDEDLAENLAEILDGLGYAPSIATSAEDALKLVAAERVDGIITDYRLPGRGGVELLNELRATGFAGPVVMMSGYMDHATVNQALKDGALDVLPKPVDLERLSRLVAEFSRAGARILIVDDNRELAENIAEVLGDLENIAEVLAAHGFEAIVAGSEREALDQRSLTQLALVDLRLPDASGVDVAERLAARDPRIKILFMTAFDEEARRAETGGRLPCIEKPFDVQQLVEQIRQAATSG